MSVLGTVLFDEAHNEAWTIRASVAERVNPTKPSDASFARAATAAQRRGFDVQAHTDGPLTPDVLADVDVLVIAHPSESTWERVVDGLGPKLESFEIEAIESHVRAGGGLVVFGECDQDKYGNNVNELLGRFGLHIRTTTVLDPVNRAHGVDTWVLAQPGRQPERHDLLAGVQSACFYRAGVIDVGPGVAYNAPLLTASTATAPNAPLLVAVEAGRGRVVALADSDIVGDDSIDELDHERLLTNVLSWAAGTASAHASTPTPSVLAADPAWAALTEAVTALRAMQRTDGSIDTDLHDAQEARALIEAIDTAVGTLAAFVPHDEPYLRQARVDLLRWAEGGFGVPDFLDSLMLFHPEQHRLDGLEHLVLFCMYTQNGNPSRVLEAVALRTVWPEWVAELEGSRYDNAAFVPVTFTGFTAGYDTHSAVLFPETVAVREVPRFTWGAIFCDREAARFRSVCGAAVETLRLALPPDAARLLADQHLAQDTYVLWDLIHDRTHSHGDLPFDPFMIKQRMPYWMYALEELRCDLTAFREAVQLEADGVPHGAFVQYAVLFDRLFRFPITGARVRNYDGLGGQILFAYLHRENVIRWTDNRLAVDWKALPDAVVALHAAVSDLYHQGIDRSKVAQWLAAYDLVAGYVPPSPASTWAKGVSALPMDGEPRALVDLVLPDEFPLNTFYEALRRKLADTVAATSGITA